MRKVVQQTRFYKNADQAISLFTNKTAFPGGKVETSGNLEEIMKLVVKFCVDHDIVPEVPSVGYGKKADAPNVNLRFDPSYILKASEK